MTMSSSWTSANTTEELHRDFRTITTMLSVLQQSPIAIKPMCVDKDTDTNELKVLCALATLLVRQHEVTAVASYSNKLGTTIYATVSPDNVPTYLVTMNPRSDVVEGSQSKVVIYENSPTTINIDNPLKYVLEAWQSQTFADHAQALVDLVHQHIKSNSPDKEQGFIFYIVANSFPKMLGRLTKPLLALPFYEAIQAIQTFDHKDTVVATSLDANDELINANKAFDNNLFRVLPSLEQSGKICASNLRAALCSGDSPPGSLYNAKTSTEFHSILRTVLSGLKESLEKLGNFKAQDGQKGLENCVKDVAFYGLALHSIVYGSMLEPHLCAIKDLLQRHHSAFVARAKKKKKPSQNQQSPMQTASQIAPDETEFEFDETETEFDEIEIEQDAETELMEVQPRTRQNDVNLPVWEAFREWLHLMVSYFESYRVLTDYLATHVNASLSDLPPSLFKIKVATVPLQRDDMTPWKELVPKYVESTNNTIAHPTSDDHTVSDESISEGPTESHAGDIPITDDTRAADLFNATSTGGYFSPERDLDNTYVVHYDGSSAASQSGSDDADTLTLASKLNKITSADDVFKIIKLLRGSDTTKHFEVNFCPESPLAKGNRFKGTVHCEASLASLILGSFEGSDWIDEQTKHEFSLLSSTLGISKHSCPVCSRLVNILKGQDGSQITIPGSHRTVYPCTLPPWLPSHIVQKMISTFWDTLVKELIIAANSCNASRERRPSSGSHGIHLGPGDRGITRFGDVLIGLKSIQK